MPVAVQAETLPTLDLRRFDAGGAERPRFLNKLLMAARNVGFFYLVGHGIENSLIRDVLSVSRRFFALPEKDKLAIEMVNSPHFRGYNRAGYGKPDWREQVDIGPERPALPFDPAVPPWARLQGPNQWPAAFPEFKPILLAYQKETTALALRLLRAFAAALEQPEDVFAPIYTPAPNPHQDHPLSRPRGRRERSGRGRPQGFGVRDPSPAGQAGTSPCRSLMRATFCRLGASFCTGARQSCATIRAFARPIWAARRRREPGIPHCASVWSCSATALKS